MELYVLAEANDIAALFPGVRPYDDVFAAYADRAALDIDGHGPRVPIRIVEDGLALLDSAERRRIVDSWCDPYPDRWAAMIADGGSETPIRRAVVAGAVRVAILERCPLPREALAVFEGGLFGNLPANALTLLAPPQGTWSIDEAIAADGIVPGGPRFEPARFDALERYAQGCVTNEHIERLRDAATRIEMQLPIVGLPRASATLAAACAIIATDEGWCAAISARQLALYASDPGVAAEARPSRPSV